MREECDCEDGVRGFSREACLPCLPWRVARSQQNVSRARSGPPPTPPQPPPCFRGKNNHIHCQIRVILNTKPSILGEVLKYFEVGLEHAVGRYLEEMMTKLGITASQRSPATPKHLIIISSHLDANINRVNGDANWRCKFVADKHDG